ncbi:hypothetical protein D3C72_1974790 [compost metagenome]
MVKYKEGENKIKVIAKTKEGKEITDEITQEYQTAKWTKPAKLVLEKIAEKDNIVLIQARLYDENNILCLDARNYVTFGLTGEGTLIDDRGTSDGSRKVQLYNGRAVISVNLNKGKSVASIKAEGIPVSFLPLN